jgi:hypothetical protein
MASLKLTALIVITIYQREYYVFHKLNTLEIWSEFTNTFVTTQPIQGSTWARILSELYTVNFPAERRQYTSYVLQKSMCIFSIILFYHK